MEYRTALGWLKYAFVLRNRACQDVPSLVSRSFDACSTANDGRGAHNLRNEYLLWNWWLVIQWPSARIVSIVGKVFIISAVILEQKNMWLRFVDLVVFPSQTLLVSRLAVSPGMIIRRLLRTWVIPRARHSSSHNSLSVPFELSK